ncbi:FecR family protein [Sphingobium sp. B11D3D]|uniref:FecR family protein n=1 Tax=Sphingobium sp. B11D3D TaxID=2940576 RepID=UPI0022259FF2|nr:FecR domain-containing protein [Sphingobium sp. B11D3D]MCW2369449.1 transmembrane sensor [Sphingobium sp. B11D3D]
MKFLPRLVRPADRPTPVDAPGWVARVRSGTLPPQEVRQFERWLAERDENRRDYDALVAQFLELDRLRSHPEIMALREEARQAQRGKRRLAIAAALGLLLTGAVTAVVALDLLPTSSEQRASVVTAYYETPEGKTSAIVLPDGSKVFLDASSALKASMGETTRRIELLSGRANFAVAKDRERPFVVMAGGERIKALGTQFDVNLVERSVELTLMEGHVVVQGLKTKSDTASTVFMRPGYRLVAGDGNWTLAPVDLRNVSRWREGVLIFDEARLGDIVAEMNRYLPAKILIGTPAIAERRMSAVLRAGDVSTFLSAIDAMGVARWTRVSDGEYRLLDIARERNLNARLR